MDISFKQYALLAELFGYPEEDFRLKVREVQEYLDREYPQAGEILLPFTELISRISRTAQEELFTRTFDVQAITTMDLGYVLFGDDYKRGAILVNLNREHRDAGNDCGNELADHLPNVLRLLAKMKKPELRVELVQKIVSPALRKINNEFDPRKIEQKNKIYHKHHRTLLERPENFGTIYQFPIKAVYTVLNDDFGSAPVEIRPHASNFLKSVGREMNLETE